MVMLAVDTTQDGVYLALSGRRPDDLPQYSLTTMDRGHGEAFFPLLSALMAQAEYLPTELTAIVVNTGPGAFTGIRTGVAAARGLALGLSVPTIGLDAFCPMINTLPPMAGVVGVVIAGGRPQGWLRRYHYQAGWQALETGQAQHWANLPPVDALYGEGAATVAAQHGLTDLGTPSAHARLTQMLIDGAVALQKGMTANATPNYLRAADALPSQQQPPRILS